MTGLTLPGAVCPCGSTRPTAACCGAVHADPTRAVRAEQLMRARYSAFALGHAAFLRESWDPATRPPVVDVGPAVTWTGLAIVDIVDGGPDDTTGVVEFRARYETGGTAGEAHERSRFRRAGHRWLYVEAVQG